MQAREKLSIAASVATDLLAIAGLAGLLYGALALSDNYFEKLEEPDIWVRPICERFAAPAARFSDGTAAEPKIIGVEVKTKKDATDIRIRIDGAHYITQWWMSSNGMTPEEVLAVYPTLPKGKLESKSIFISIPRLMANTDVVIQYSGIPKEDFRCSAEWFQVSAPGLTTYHFVSTDGLPVREYSKLFVGFNLWKQLFIITASILVGMVLFRRAKEKSAKRK